MLGSLESSVNLMQIMKIGLNIQHILLLCSYQSCDLRPTFEFLVADGAIRNFTLEQIVLEQVVAF
jgi:hypothetical protein